LFNYDEDKEEKSRQSKIDSGKSPGI